MNDKKRSTEIEKYTSDCLTMMKDAHIVLPEKASVNIYHHCGADKLGQVGAMFINVVNRDYCKNIVVMTAGQSYPNHYHRIKTESFYVLYGELIVVIDGAEHTVRPGELLHIERGCDHSFRTVNGTVFEEISTMYVPNDSVYTDEEIAKTSYSGRRTSISPEQWKEIKDNA